MPRRSRSSFVTNNPVQAQVGQGGPGDGAGSGHRHPGPLDGSSPASCETSSRGSSSSARSAGRAASTSTAITSSSPARATRNDGNIPMPKSTSNSTKPARSTRSPAARSTTRRGAEDPAGRTADHLSLQRQGDFALRSNIQGFAHSKSSRGCSVFMVHAGGAGKPAPTCSAFLSQGTALEFDDALAVMLDGLGRQEYCAGRP